MVKNIFKKQKMSGVFEEDKIKKMQLCFEVIVD